MYDLIIIGSGAAGLSAGIYAGRYKLNTLIIGDSFGGMTSFAWKIENYPGFLSIDGIDLMNKFKKQVENLGVKIVNEKVEEIKQEGDIFNINNKKAKTLIIATGTKRKKLGIKNEDKFAHYCMICDGPLYKDKIIAIVGGGDSAVKSAALGAEYAKKIYLIVREPELIAEPINVEKVKNNKINILYNTEVKEILDKKIKLSNNKYLDIDGLFIEIGAEPNIIKGLGFDGYIKVDNMMRTQIKGVYAAGDITNFFGDFKQDITAVAVGAVAAHSAYSYLSTGKK